MDDHLIHLHAALELESLVSFSNSVVERSVGFFPCSQLLHNYQNQSVGSQIEVEAFISFEQPTPRIDKVAKRSDGVLHSSHVQIFNQQQTTSSQAEEGTFITLEQILVGGLVATMEPMQEGVFNDLLHAHFSILGS